LSPTPAVMMDQEKQLAKGMLGAVEMLSAIAGPTTALANIAAGSVHGVTSLAGQSTHSAARLVGHSASSTDRPSSPVKA
jgi:hypothetical protein